MDAAFTCRSCRRGRCDQCDGGGCACESCAERAVFAPGGIVPAQEAGSADGPPAFLLRSCLYG